MLKTTMESVLARHDEGEFDPLDAAVQQARSALADANSNYSELVKAGVAESTLDIMGKEKAAAVKKLVDAIKKRAEAREPKKKRRWRR